MKAFNRSLSMLALLIVLPLSAHADLPGKHPHYLRALSDLRTARWLIQNRPAKGAIASQEDIALTEIQATIDAIKVAAKEDGKKLQDRPPSDGTIGDKGKLADAIKFLNKARNDVTAEEDNPASAGQQAVVLQHLDAALAATQQAYALAQQNAHH